MFYDTLMWRLPLDDDLQKQAWQAARSELISEQEIVGSNPTVPTTAPSAQASDLSPDRLGAAPLRKVTHHPRLWGCRPLGHTLTVTAPPAAHTTRLDGLGELIQAIGPDRDRRGSPPGRSEDCLA